MPRLLTVGSLLAAALGLAACASGPRNPLPEAQTYLCEREYVNFARGYVRRGTYVDAEGGVYRYAHGRGAERWKPARSDAGYAPQDLAARYAPDRTFVRTLNREELAQLRRLIVDARAGTLSDRTTTAYDRGTATGSPPRPRN